MEQRDPQSTESRRRRARRASLTPLSLFLVLIVFYLVVEVRIVVLLLLFSILFATLIERPVLRLERHGFPRAAAVLAVYLAILAVSASIFLLVVPPITSEALRFWDEAPVLLDDLAEEWRTSDNSFLSTTGYRVATQLQFRIENPPPPTGSTAIGLVTGVGGALIGLVATFVIGFYYLMEKQLFSQVHARSGSTDESRMGRVGLGQRRGKVGRLATRSVALDAHHRCGCRRLVRDSGCPVLAPVGAPRRDHRSDTDHRTWIGGIPAVMLALVDSWEKAIAVAAFLGILQLLENTILVPRVMRGTIGLSPLAVFIAVSPGASSRDRSARSWPCRLPRQFRS